MLRQWPIVRVAIVATAMAGALTSPVVAQPPSTGAAVTVSLGDAIRLAAGSSEEIALARAGEQRARAQQLQARSAMRPQVSTTLNWQKQLQNQFAAISKRSANSSTGGGTDTTSGDNAASPLTRIFASEYNFNLGITASQPLYTGGLVAANRRAARAGKELADIGITSASAQVLLTVTQAYYDALLSDRLLAIADSTVVQAERTLRQVQLTRSVGSASEFELIRAQVTRDNQRPAWLQARTNRELAYVRLRQLLNLDADRVVVLTDSIVETPVSPTASSAPVTTVNVVAAEVLAVDPQVTDRVSRTLATTDTVPHGRAPVRQALKALEVAQNQLRATKAQRRPSVAATTNYQRLAYPANVLPKSLADFYPNWTVGIGLSYPLFSGGRIRGDILAAEAAVIEAEQRVRQAEDAAAFDARASTAQLRQAEAAWQASVGTSEQAQRAYTIAEVRFREGISTQLELSETRVQLQQALANRARSARDLQVAKKRLELLRDLPFSAINPSTGSNP